MKKITNEYVSDFFDRSLIKEQTPLCEILKKFGSDKCSDWHNYSPFYNYIFESDKDKSLNLFEVGILFGSSIKSWEEYFQNSQIYSGDFNTDYLINEGRIKSYFCNQDDIETIKNMWELDELKYLKFDIIIDDGKHEFMSNYNFLTNSYHKLNDGGIFIVEDLTEYTFINFNSYLPEFIKTYNPSFIKLLKIDNPNNSVDNNILLIQK